MIISVLFAILYSSQEKEFQKNSLNEEQAFIFNFVEDILFFPVCRETNYFSKNSQTSPPPNIKWSLPYVHFLDGKPEFLHFRAQASPKYRMCKRFHRQAAQLLVRPKKRNAINYDCIKDQGIKFNDKPFTCTIMYRKVQVNFETLKMS